MRRISGLVLEDLGNASRGGSGVLWIWCGCATNEAKYVLMGPKINNVWAGSELLSGHNLDNDGLNDLIVGGADFGSAVTAWGQLG